MIDALADASLNSACLSTANFNRVISGLDGDARNTAVRMRESGIRTLNDTRAWSTCRSQAEQATLLRMNMDTAQTWSLQRAQARRDALLADHEEVEDGVLVDRNTKAPINSNPVLAFPVDFSLLLEGTYGARGTFDAALTISEDGLVTACEVVSSIGNERADQAICRKAGLLMRYRPAFVNGRVATSTTHLRLRVTD
ncbi:MAG: energy transducer TonB [Pseudomonadota bacterium]|nr:energy transducer TonB [Pseudomonadota bacterium]